AARPGAEPDFHIAAAKHERFIKSTKFLKHGTPHHHTRTRDCQIIPVPACATVHSVAKRGKIGERMVGEAAESDDNSGMLYVTLGTQQLTTDNTYGLVQCPINQLAQPARIIDFGVVVQKQKEVPLCVAGANIIDSTVIERPRVVKQPNLLVAAQRSI